MPALDEDQTFINRAFIQNVWRACIRQKYIDTKYAIFEHNNK